MSTDKLHYVYTLHDADGLLLYIGRSVNPKERRRVFERRTGLSVTINISDPYVDFEDAVSEEIRLIKEHNPPFNKYVASSPSRLGMQNSRAHNKAISTALKGRIMTPEHKAKLWAERDRSPESNPFFGKKHSKKDCKFNTRRDSKSVSRL